MFTVLRTGEPYSTPTPTTGTTPLRAFFDPDIRITPDEASVFDAQLRTAHTLTNRVQAPASAFRSRHCTSLSCHTPSRNH